MVIVTTDYSFGTSPYIVNPILGVGTFTTIASAVAAAAANGGGTVYVQPGTYTENVLFPGNVSVIGSETGTASFSISLEGNQTFTGGGTASFQNILFVASSGITWTLGATTSTSSQIDFTNCSIQSPSGTGIQITNNISNTNLYLNGCTISSDLNAISAVNNGVYVTIESSNSNISSVDSDAISLTGSSLNTLQIDSSVVSSGSGNGVVLSSPAAQLNSSYSSYTATVAAFRFTTSATVTSYYDVINASGIYFAQSTGSYGSLIYAFMTLIGNRSADPQISVTARPVFGSGITWSDVSSNRVINVGTGSFTTGLVTLTLPPTPNQGDTCAFVVSSGSILTIQANAGQSIRIGEYLTSIAGTAASSQQGDSLSLVYRSTSSTWMTTSSIGNWLVT